MMKNLKLLALLFPALVFFSCAGEKQFEQVHIFPDTSWQRFNILSFDFPVKQTADEYSIQAIFRYTEDFEPDRLPLHFIMTFPSGEQRIWVQTLLIRDQERNFLGEYKDGIYETVATIRTRLLFRETGNCKITIEQVVPKYKSHGIVSFGLRLSRN